MKTHSGAKKRFRVTATGKVRGRHRSRATSSRRSRPSASGAWRRPAVISKHDEATREGPPRGQALMTRVKRSIHARKKRRATLALAKGYRGDASRHYRVAKEAVLKADQYRYRDRRNRKRDFRRLWITRINAAAREQASRTRSSSTASSCRASSSTARCSRHRRP